MPKRSRRRARLENWLNATTAPVFLLDARRKVLFCNGGCERLTGWSAEELRQQICEYDTEPEPTSLAAVLASLCPPPDVLKGQLAGVPSYVPHREGHTTARLVHFYPLPDAEGRVEYILGVMTPLLPPHPLVRATSAQQLHAELAALRHALRQRYGVKSLVARGEPMQRVLRQMRLAQQTDVPVLFLGEPGVGKEHLARIIHYESTAGRRSFVPLDCRRLAAWELKRILRRAVEPAEAAPGTTAALQPGTLYLDHVDALPRDVQERLVEAFAPAATEINPRPKPTAAESPRRPEVAEIRLMAASDRPLQSLVASDELRADLYYLLTPLTIDIPPLRSRPDDLPLLAQHLLESQNRGSEQQIGGFSDEVWEQFRRYNWPGNVEELAAVIAEARAVCTGPLIGTKDLPFRFRTGTDAQTVGPVRRRKPVPLEPFLAQVEREQIELALAESRQNKSKAAELLGLTRARLYRRMEALGIEDREAVGE